MDEQREFEYILDFIKGKKDFFGDAHSLLHLMSLWTAYCLHQSLVVETRKYNNRMMEMWEAMLENDNAPYPSSEYDLFYRSMCRYLV